MSCRTPLTFQSCNSTNKTLLSSFDEIVAHYIDNHRENASDEILFYKQLDSLDKAITKAGLALTVDDRKHPHQYRISNETLKELSKSLKSIDYSVINSFSELIKVLEDEIRPIRGVGDLLIYDTALRIGAFLGYEPEYVYLHADTMQGAKNLDLNYSRGYLEIEELPKQFHRLQPPEIEDCLCIYKDSLASINFSKAETQVNSYNFIYPIGNHHANQNSTHYRPHPITQHRKTGASGLQGCQSSRYRHQRHSQITARHPA